jgi:hypothetical protein
MVTMDVTIEKLKKKIMYMHDDFRCLIEFITIFFLLFHFFLSPY